MYQWRGPEGHRALLLLSFFCDGRLGPKDKLYMVHVSRKARRPSVGVGRPLKQAGDHALRTVHPDVRQLLVTFFAETETP